MEELWRGRSGPEARTKPRTLTKATKQTSQAQVSVSGYVIAPSNAVRSHMPLAVARAPSKMTVSPETPPPQPYSRTEQYWAARALSAEALLSARTAHHNEVRGVLLAAENKRRKELHELAREHGTRYARLEKFVAGLFLWLLTFVLYVIYLLAHSSHRRPRETSRWSTLLPNHFTIPILSPFTSVVESETAVIGARTVVMLIVVAGAVVYGILKHRMNGRSTPS